MVETKPLPKKLCLILEKPRKTRSTNEDANEMFLRDGSNIMELLGMVEPRDDASSAENDAEDLSISSSDGEDSDAEDVFKLNAMKPQQFEKPYTTSFLYCWQQATVKLMQMLRSDVLLPLHPDLGHLGVVWKQVDKAVALPSWHCAFQGCSATSAAWDNKNSHEAGSGTTYVLPVRTKRS